MHFPDQRNRALCNRFTAWVKGLASPSFLPFLLHGQESFPFRVCTAFHSPNLEFLGLKSLLLLHGLWVLKADSWAHGSPGLAFTSAVAVGSPARWKHRPRKCKGFSFSTLPSSLECSFHLWPPESALPFYPPEYSWRQSFVFAPLYALRANQAGCPAPRSVNLQQVNDYTESSKVLFVSMPPPSLDSVFLLSGNDMDRPLTSYHGHFRTQMVPLSEKLKGLWGAGWEAQPWCWPGFVLQSISSASFSVCFWRHCPCSTTDWWSLSVLVCGLFVSLQLEQCYSIVPTILVLQWPWRSEP